ncbi:MAG: serine/threonine protein kinase [Ruthenibacterium lactatiformans]
MPWANRSFAATASSNADSGLPACPYCGQSFENTNPAGTLPVNTLLAGRYTIGRVLALDGEGVLYAAIDNSATRRVVIKEYVPVTICAARSRDGSVIPRQGREVLFKTTRMDFVDLYRSLVALGRNDGLVQVLDLIEENNTAYAVREPDEGTPLLTYLEQRAQPLTQSEALLLLRPVVYGVEAMHRMGLLHRGISPETVFITKTGSAKLSGYATLGLRTADSELKSQMFDGYAAPEQYAVAEFDGKYTDIYGLGALFYRVLTGKTPVPANLRRMNDTLPPAHTVDRDPGLCLGGHRAGHAPCSRRAHAVCVRPSAAITAPEKDEGGFRLTQRQIKFLALGAAGLVLVAAVSIWAIVSASGGGEASSSSSSSSSSGTSVSSGSSEVEVFTVPSFVGKIYRPGFEPGLYEIRQFSYGARVQQRL